jgi:hypothetical protein
VNPPLSDFRQKAQCLTGILRVSMPNSVHRNRAGNPESASVRPLHALHVGEQDHGAGAPADFEEAGSAPGVNWVVTGPTPLVFV